MNIKFPYSKKFLKATLALALVAAPATTLIQPGQASAATLVQSQPINGGVAPAKQVTAATDAGSIEVTVYNDDKKTVFTDETLQVTIYDKSGTLVSSGDTAKTGTYTTSATNGVAGNVGGKLAKGTYYVTISNGTVWQTTEVKVSKTAKVKLTWESTKLGTEKLQDDKKAIKKTGAIAGVVYEGTTSDVAQVAKVTVVSKKTQWTTSTDAHGIFKLYVPTGTYDVIVTPESGGSSKIYSKVKVTANQTALPLEQLAGDATLTGEAAKLGFKLTTSEADIKKPETTKFAGSVNAYATVSVYTVSSGDTFDVGTNALASADSVYTWVADKTVGKAKTGTTADFSISVKKNALAGKTIVFVVTDQAGNVYEDTKTYTVDKIDAPALSASAAAGSTPDSTKIKVTPKTSGNTITLRVGTGAATTPKLGDAAPATNDTVGVVIKNYTSGNDVILNGKTVVDVYEVDKDGNVVLYKKLSLTATQIKK